ncbi:lysophospholipid acyltransferase family protein [Compostibacter hankyongensis]|uniref:Phospholipid/glycerol acyltransferase domain-containing protein n=1 Tax=Compostibacter hankyongensis TaxID=1007089 RepID=A0ABP8FPU2_9BACT
MTQKRIPALQRILGRVYALYALLMFIITILLVAIPVSLAHLLVRDDRRRTKIVMDSYRVWMGVYLPLIGCPVTRTGQEHFRPDTTYVVVYNHNSLADVLVSTPYVPGASKTLAKKELARIPVFGLIYRSGSVLVDRSDPNSRLKSIEDMKAVLAQGMHMILYPEGTRNKTSAPLKPFYKGAFKVAVESQHPIVPALIFHTREILPPGLSFYAWPHRIRIRYMPPVPTAGLGPDDVPALTEKIFHQMRDGYIAGAGGNAGKA